MRFLLDTSAFSDLMNEHPQAEERLAALPSRERVLICPIVRGEVLYGIRRLAAGRRRQSLESRASHLFHGFVAIPVPVTAGDHYADLKIAREQAGLPLDENDLWIAATALALGATLVTRDTDFQGIEGLVVEDWTT